jgi:hypothetical protein
VSDKIFYRLSGFSLVIASILMVATMMLHPTGGSIEHIIKMAKIAIIAHSLAILSMGFIGFGFYGVSKLLLTDNKLSYLALSFASFSLVAAMFAAVFNGLVLPMYVLKYVSRTSEETNTIRLIINYGFTINKALDYLFIVGLSVAMFIWSILIIKTKILSKWIGYWGIVLPIICFIGIFFQFNFISVTHFTIYILCIVSWIISVGISLIKIP